MVLFYVALVCFCLFPLPLRVWDGLRLVIVALPGLFSDLVLIFQANCLHVSAKGLNK